MDPNLPDDPNGYDPTPRGAVAYQGQDGKLHWLEIPSTIGDKWVTYKVNFIDSTPQWEVYG